MVTELRSRTGHQTHLDREPRQRSGAHLTKIRAPSTHGDWIEITGFAQRFLTEELRDKRRLRFHVKTVQRRAENHFVPTRHGFRHPAFGQKAQQMFVAESAKS